MVLPKIHVSAVCKVKMVKSSMDKKIVLDVVYSWNRIKAGLVPMVWPVWLRRTGFFSNERI